MNCVDLTPSGPFVQEAIYRDRLSLSQSIFGKMFRTSWKSSRGNSKNLVSFSVAK